MKKFLSIFLSLVMVVTSVAIMPISAYAGFKCEGCDEWKQDSKRCKECKQCEDCVELCESCGEVCHDCMSYCEECGRCRECCSAGGFELCEGCEALCIECASGQFCEECRRCMNCVDICNECGSHCYECNPGCEECGRCGHCLEREGFELCTECQAICIECANGSFCRDCVRCLNCVQMCEECDGYCIECSQGCEECGRCGNCLEDDGVRNCDDCGRCEDCVGELCEDCGRCRDCAPQFCENCGEACADCRKICGDCGLCSECNGDTICESCGNACGECSKICENCHICENCAEICENGDHCSECAALCDNCGLCEDCTTICEYLGDHCSECADAFCYECNSCSNCVKICPICGICSGCSGATMCGGCNACSNCTKICQMCGDACENCDRICKNCDNCSDCTAPVFNCGYCDDCCNNGMHCYRCGRCTEADGIKFTLNDACSNAFCDECTAETPMATELLINAPKPIVGTKIPFTAPVSGKDAQYVESVEIKWVIRDRNFKYVYTSECEVFEDGYYYIPNFIVTLKKDVNSNFHYVDIGDIAVSGYQIRINSADVYYSWRDGRTIIDLDGYDYVNPVNQLDTAPELNDNLFCYVEKVDNVSGIGHIIKTTVQSGVIRVGDKITVTNPDGTKATGTVTRLAKRNANGGSSEAEFIKAGSVANIIADGLTTSNTLVGGVIQLESTAITPAAAGVQVFGLVNLTKTFSNIESESFELVIGGVSHPCTLVPYNDSKIKANTNTPIYAVITSTTPVIYRDMSCTIKQGSTTVGTFVACPTVHATSIRFEKSVYDFNLYTSNIIKAITDPSYATDRITYTSSNTSVAFVDPNGAVTINGLGSTTITATVNGKSATC